MDWRDRSSKKYVSGEIRGSDLTYYKEWMVDRPHCTNRKDGQSTTTEKGNGMRRMDCITDAPNKDKRQSEQDQLQEESQPLDKACDYLTPQDFSVTLYWPFMIDVEDVSEVG